MYGTLISAPTPTSWMSSCAACAPKSMIRSRKSSSTPFAASVMFSKRAEPRSIATQLVVLFTLCAALLLSCSLGVFYWIVVRHAVEEDNAVLADKIQAVGENLKQVDGLDALTREIKSLRPGEPLVYWIRILDPDRKAVAET